MEVFIGGLFIGLIVFIALKVLGGVNKGADKLISSAFISTNDVGKLLQHATYFANKGQLKEAQQAYEKVLTIEPNNAMALVSLGFLYFQNGHFDQAEDCYQKIYNYYFVENPSAQKTLDEKLLGQLNIALYRYGFLWNKKGQTDRALELKTLSLQNNHFRDNYTTLRKELSY